MIIILCTCNDCRMCVCGFFPLLFSCFYMYMFKCCLCKRTHKEFKRGVGATMITILRNDFV